MTLLNWLLVNPFGQIFVGFGLVFVATIIFALVVVSIEMATGTILGEWPGKINLFFKRFSGG